MAGVRKSKIGANALFHAHVAEATVHARLQDS